MTEAPQPPAWTLPRNPFKAAIAAGRQQIGLWCSLPSAFAAEIVAPAGYDWLLFDTEHSPSSVPIVMSQLQVAARYPVAPAVRASTNDADQIKRLLDIGTLTLFVPYVQSAAEARQVVAATRYPPAGIRGVSGMTRANYFGRVPDYIRDAASELCVIVQVETQAALDEIEAIAAVDGVDGIFIGPADLSTSLGFAGNQSEPRVQAVILETIQRIRAAGKPAGILTLDTEFARRCIAAGTLFTAVGIDAAMLARGSDALRQAFNS
jgi:4-hydroxy-2-oxoheptanedioate aldolase